MKAGAFFLLLIGFLIVYLGVTKKFDCLTSFVSCILSVAIPTTTISDTADLPTGSTSPAQMGGIQLPPIKINPLPLPSPTIDLCKTFPNLPGCPK